MGSRYPQHTLQLLCKRAEGPRTPQRAALLGMGMGCILSRGSGSWLQGKLSLLRATTGFGGHIAGR